MELFILSFVLFKTRCQHCKKLLVPFLTIHLRDFRSHPPSAVNQLCTSNLTPGVSQESVVSFSHSRKSSDGGDKLGKDDLEAQQNATLRKIQPPAATIIEPISFGPISVPYLSPLVLRRELENILEQEGDVSLTQSAFVNQHSILYWNMLWYFERVGLVSHIGSLILGANVGLNETNNNNNSDEREVSVASRIHASWISADERNVSIKTMWDNPRIHEEVFCIKITSTFYSVYFICIFRSGLLVIHCGSKPKNSSQR